MTSFEKTLILVGSLIAAIASTLSMLNREMYDGAFITLLLSLCLGKMLIDKLKIEKE